MKCHNCGGKGSPDYAGFAMDECVYCKGTGQLHPDDNAVDKFANQMKAKLALKRSEGRGGWENKDTCSQLFLSLLLHDHVLKGDPLDVANIAMMLHSRQESILPISVSQ